VLENELKKYNVTLDFTTHKSKKSLHEQLEAARVVLKGVTDADAALRKASGGAHGLNDYLHNRPVTVFFWGSGLKIPADCQTAKGGPPIACTQGAERGDGTGIQMNFFNDGMSQRDPSKLGVTEFLITHELSHAILGSGRVYPPAITKTSTAFFPFPGTENNDFPGLEDWGRSGEYGPETLNLYLWTLLKPGEQGFNQDDPAGAKDFTDVDTWFKKGQTQKAMAPPATATATPSPTKPPALTPTPRKSS